MIKKIILLILGLLFTISINAEVIGNRGDFQNLKGDNGGSGLGGFKVFVSDGDGYGTGLPGASLMNILKQNALKLVKTTDSESEYKKARLILEVLNN